ncbi:MAG TPA: protein kinase, partial [Pirellulales bacterium]
MTDASSKLRESATDADLSGRQLDDYSLIRRLARGAMAEVYLANQHSLRRSVAVKVLKAELAKDSSYVKRFHNEAQAAASLVHANIVQIYSVGCADGAHYIAQEYVQGQNLREWLSRNGPAQLTSAVTIMRQVSAALQKAAERGIVHRDIKPENIMLARTGEVKVADFGLARQTGDVAQNLT